MKSKLMPPTTHPTTQRVTAHRLQQKCMDTCQKCSATLPCINTKKEANGLALCECVSVWSIGGCNVFSQHCWLLGRWSF